MKFGDFERRARRAFAEIPDAYLHGIDGLVVRRDAPEHPELPGVYTLGECLTEEHLSDFGSSETTRSVIALYWGSFRALARENPDFDWEGEIWETLTHELRHHLESLAGDDALEDVDYAANEGFKRFDEQPFDPWYYQYGEPEGDGLYRVEKDWYLEVEMSLADFEATEAIPFRWRDRRYAIARPDEMGDVHYVLVHGIDAGEGALEVVLLRRRSFWERVGYLVGGGRAEVLESEADAEPVDDEG